MNAKIIIALLVSTIGFVSVQCTNDVAEFSCPDAEELNEVSYSQDVFPIVSRSCAVPDCHVGNFPNGDFKTYDDLKAKADNGKLFFRLSNGQMPPADSKFPPLTFCEFNAISQWIREGAKNN